MKGLFAAVLILASMIAHASSAKESHFEWSLAKGPHSYASLSYAIPESDEGFVWFSCAEPPRINVAPQIPTKGLKEGETGLIKLLGANAKAVIPGKAYQSSLEGEGILLSGHLPSVKHLLPLFAKDGFLSIDVPGNSAKVPINRQAREALTEFMKHCTSGW